MSTENEQPLVIIFPCPFLMIVYQQNMHQGELNLENLAIYYLF